MAAEHEPQMAVYTLVVLGSEKTGKKTLIRKVRLALKAGSSLDLTSDSSTTQSTEKQQIRTLLVGSQKHEGLTERNTELKFTALIYLPAKAPCTRLDKDSYCYSP